MKRVNTAFVLGIMNALVSGMFLPVHFSYHSEVLYPFLCELTIFVYIALRLATLVEDFERVR
jgi:hypothetical protein